MKKRMLAFVLALVTALCACGVVGSAEIAEAAKTKTVLTVGEKTSTQVNLTPGETTQVTLPIRMTEGYIFEPEFEITASENAPFAVGPEVVYMVIADKLYTESVSISSGENTYLQFAVTAKETAKIGKYELRIKCVDYLAGDAPSEEEGGLNDIVLTCVISEEKLPAELAISNLSVSGTLKPGGTAKVSFTVTNAGELEAKNVRLSADYSDGSLLPDYTDYTKKLGDMKPKGTQRVTLRVKVLETVDRSVVQLPLTITYNDNEGKSYSADKNNILYLEVELPEEETFENGTLLVSNVRQSPAKPKAGEKVSLTFDMENTGEKDYTETKLYLGYVSGKGFEPVKAEPYQYVGTIKAGQKKSVTVNLVAGKEIAAGMNTLDVEYTYFDGAGEEVSGEVTLYVLNVQEKKKEEESTGLGKPKLMVSRFTTDKEIVKSGEEFDFTFVVYNTHSEIAAENIKVTVTSEKFSVTKGSDSFFLPVINPGEGEEITINLKASAAALTGSYPVEILMEYEYDGMPVSESGDGGVEVTEKKMIPVKENLRVSVENVTLGGWQTPYVDQTTQLSFSIYNMGKSALSNVFFTVEGDFTVANGSSYYYGTLQEGYPDYVEMEIIPSVAGEAKGKLIIHMEDSNGDEVTYEAEISGEVMEEDSFEPEGEDPGEDLPTDVFPMDDTQEGEKAMISMPVLLGIIGGGVFVLVFVIVLVVVLATRKKKKGTDMYED